MEYRYLYFNDKRITSARLRSVKSAEITTQWKKKNSFIDALEITARCKFCQNHQDYLEKKKKNPQGN